MSARSTPVLSDERLIGYIDAPRLGTFVAYSSFPEPMAVFKSKELAVTHLENIGALYEKQAPAFLRRQANASPAKKKRRRQFEYKVGIVEAGKRTNQVKTFWSASDKHALGYCNGLLKSRLPNGARVASCKATGKSRYVPGK